MYPLCVFAEHLLLMQCHHEDKDDGILIPDAVPSDDAKEALEFTPGPSVPHCPVPQNGASTFLKESMGRLNG